MNDGDYRPVIKTYVGATARTLTFYAKEDDGTAKDLSGFATASISADLGGTAKLSEVAVTISDAAAGVLTFVDADGDLDTAGEYDAQIRLETASAAVDYLEPMTMLVRDPVYNAGA